MDQLGQKLIGFMQDLCIAMAHHGPFSEGFSRLDSLRVSIRRTARNLEEYVMREVIETLKNM